MNALTRDWVRKADRDLQMAQLGHASADPPRDGVCFHCQQLSEKYLKALVQELGLPLVRTHDLDTLLTQLLPHYPTLRRYRRGLAFLTDFAVESRYPGKNTSTRQMKSALRWAERVRAECRALLGIKPPRRRKRT